MGLTGGIATGKSTVSSIFKSHNIPIIDADVLARQVVLPGTRSLRKIVRAFGPEILLSDGSLDRKKLGSIIFADEHKRKRLNSIVHPAVRRAMLWEVVKCWVRGEKWCVLDVPLLIEGPLWRVVGLVVVVYWCVLPLGPSAAHDPTPQPRRGPAPATHAAGQLKRDRRVCPT